jgi:fibronectin type 3 domain-containing protein
MNIDGRDPEESMRVRVASVGLVLLLVLSVPLGIVAPGEAAGVAWDPEVVDPLGNAGNGRNSIALDPGGGVHISYHRAAGGDLMYAHKLPDGTWRIETVASDGDVGYDSSIAVNSSGGVHIAYLDEENGDLGHAYKPLGGSWTTEKVDTDGRQGGLSISLAIDSQDGLHVTYSEGLGFDDDMKYAYKPLGENWSVEVLGKGLLDDYQQTGLIIDGDDVLHCLYVRRHAGLEPYGTYLEYLYMGASGQWVRKTGVHAVEDWMPMSFAMDSEGGLHASYYVYRGNKQYHYAQRPEGEDWSHEALFGPMGVGGFSSIALDGDDKVHLAYYDGSKEDMMYAFMLNNGTWTNVSVDSGGNVGKFNALTIDGDDRAHLLYYDATDRQLKYVVKSTRPSSPRSLEAQAGEGEINLSWEAPEDPGLGPVTGYTVYGGTVPGQEVVLATVGPVGNHTFTDLESGTTYHYRVVAFNEVGEGPPSSTVSASPKGPPGVPRNVTATSGDSVVVLAWLPPKSDGHFNITGYRVYRGTATGQGEFHLLVEGAAGYDDTGLENGVEYFYSVSAVNEAGEGARSPEVSATPLAPPSVPLMASARAGDSFVDLQWSSPADDGGSSIAHYRVYRGLVSGPLGIFIELDDVTSFNDTGVANGVTYYYSVGAVNEVGEGERTPEMEAIPLASPSAPLEVNVTAGNGSVLVTWSPPKDDGGRPVTNYRVYKGPEGKEEFLLLLENTTRFNDTEVTNGQTYSYRVSAVNVVGEGGLSAGRGAMPVGPPTKPLELVIENVEGLIILNWSLPASDGGAPITTFVVLRGLFPDDLGPVAEVGLVLTYTDIGIGRGQTFYYSVVAKNRVGQSEQGDVVDVKLEQIVKDDGPGFVTMVSIMALAIAARVGRKRGRR